MNFAFLLRSKAVTSVQSWANYWISGNGLAQATPTLGAVSQSVGPSTLLPSTPHIQACLQVRRPLRVVRVVESGQSRTHVGRMVISGRMADVCAELDRLAAREAADTIGPRGVAALSC